jgi:hypothetical protein
MRDPPGESRWAYRWSNGSGVVAPIGRGASLVGMLPCSTTIRRWLLEMRLLDLVDRLC